MQSTNSRNFSGSQERKSVMSRRKVTSLFAGAVCVLAMTAGQGRAADEVATLRVASFMPPQGFLSSVIVEPYLKMIEEDSQGTLKVDFFPGGTLGRSPTQQLSLVQEGSVDMAVVLPAYTPGAFEAYNVTQLPGVAATTKQSSVGAWHAYEAGLLPEPDGVQVIGLVTTASNLLHTKTPVGDLSALKGLKIRAAGSIQVNAVEKLGGAVIGNIAGPEIAEGLSRNLLDGTLMDWIGIKEFRVDRTAKNHTEANFGRLLIMLPINKAKFDSLPEPAKASILKHGGLAFAEFGGQAFDDAVDEFRSDYMSKSDNQTLTFSDADKAVVDAAFEEVVTKWVAEEDGRDKVLEAFREGAASVQ